MNKIGLLLLFVLQTTNTIFAESCLTPNNKTGEVKPLTLCSELLNLFTNTPRKSENYLNGFIVKDSLEPLVCCSSSVNITKATENKEKYGGVSVDESDYLHKSGYWFDIEDEIPWLVGIHNNNSKSNLRCSGTLINQRYVITAAECVTVDNSNIEVIVRDDEQGLIKNRTYHVEELIVHPFYNIIPGLNNIALLRLAESVYLGGLNARILLPVEKPQEGKVSDTLQNVDWISRITHGKISYHKLLSNESCQEQFKKANIMRLVTEYDICTERLNDSKSTTPQNYELGSPIMYESNTHYLIGITSSSFENNTIPKLSPRISKYLKWIEYNMRPYTRRCKIGDKVGHCVSAIVCPKKIHEIADNNRDALEEYISDRNECYDKRLSCCDTSIPQPEPPRTPYKSRILVNYTDCGISNETFHNMNDTRLYNHNFPWLADITVFSRSGIYQERTLCGGVFLNNRHVLTTARCLDRAHYDWDYTVVRYAKTNKKVDCGLTNCFNYDEADIKLWIPHEFFTESYNFNNIGLIRLAETIPLSDSTWPICLRPPEELAPKPGDTLYIYDLNNSTFKNPFVLESTMISNEECQKIYKEKNRTEIISPYDFCSNFKRYDSCDGFLGGVVMFEKDNRWFVAGVGARHCVLGLPAIHTNAQYYLKWIENNIQQNPCTTTDGKQGECVLLHECPQYVELMANPTNSSVKDLEKLMCSKRDLKEVKVCCNKSGASLYFNKTQIATVESNQTNREDVRIRKYCGWQHSDDYIGQPNEQISIDEYPWLAVIYQKRNRDNEPRAGCGGSVIHPQYVLTAAQCIIISRFSKLTKVRLAEFNIKNTTDCIMHDKIIGEECITYEEYDIAEAIPHPFFSNSIWGVLNDIGLIRLAKRIVWTEYIRPICLPDLARKPKPGTILYATGFGKISSDDEAATVDLKKGCLPHY